MFAVHLQLEDGGAVSKTGQFNFFSVALPVGGKSPVDFTPTEKSSFKKPNPTKDPARLARMADCDRLAAKWGKARSFKPMQHRLGVGGTK